MSDCGVDFDHDPHGYRDNDGNVRACDGSVTKREPHSVSTSKQK